MFSQQNAVHPQTLKDHISSGNVSTNEVWDFPQWEQITIVPRTPMMAETKPRICLQLTAMMKLCWSLQGEKLVREFWKRKFQQVLVFIVHTEEKSTGFLSYWLESAKGGDRGGVF